MPRRTRPLPRKRSNKISMNELYRRDKGICYLCENPVARSEASREHYNPKYHGGRNGPNFSNLRLAHRQCNILKGNERSWTKD